MKPIGFIYKTTCLVNGKIYIGKHEGRENDNYLGSGELFSRAVKKYGKENFKRDILRYCFTKHELRIWEYVFIKKYHSQDLNIGYNIADGDVNTTEFNPAKLPQVREKIRKATKLRMSKPENNPMFGKKNPHTEEWKKNHSCVMKGRRHTDETKRKISVAQLGNKNHMYGKHLSDERKKQLSLMFSGKNNPMYGVRLTGEKHPLYGSKFHWINDGCKNRRLKIDQSLPDGFVYGKIQKSKKICGVQ